MADQGASCCPRLDYRNIGPSAAWPLTSISHETYMKLDSHCISPWQKMPGFHFRSISHDWMHHTYLGTARDLCGSGTFPFASFFGLFPPKVILKLFILFFWEKNYFEHSNLFSCRYQTGSASKSVFRAKLCAQHKTKQFVTVWPRYQDVDRPWQVQLCDGWGRRYGRNSQPCSKEYDGHLCKTWDPWINYTCPYISIYYKLVNWFWKPVHGLPWISKLPLLCHT